MPITSNREGEIQLLRDAGLNEVTATNSQGTKGILDSLSETIDNNARLHHLVVVKSGSGLQVLTNDEYRGILRNSELPALSLRIWSWLNDGTIPNSVLNHDAANKITDIHRVIPVVPILRKKNGEHAAYFRSPDKRDNSALSAFAGVSVVGHAKLLNCETSSMKQRYTEYPLKVGILNDLLEKLKSSNFSAETNVLVSEAIKACKIEDLWSRLEAINHLAELLKFSPQIIEQTTQQQRELILALKVFTQLLKAETLLNLVEVDHGHFYNLGNATAFYIHEVTAKQLLTDDVALTANQFFEHPEVIELDPRVIASDPQVFLSYEPLVLPIDFDRVAFAPTYPEHLEGKVNLDNLLKFLNSTNEHEILMAIHYLPLDQWQEQIVPKFPQWSLRIQRQVLSYLRTASAELSSMSRYESVQSILNSLLTSANNPELVKNLFEPVINLEFRRPWNMEPYGILSKRGYTQFPQDSETEAWYGSSDREQFLLALALNDDLWYRDDVIDKVSSLPEYLQLTCLFYFYRNSSYLSEKVIDQNPKVREYIQQLIKDDSFTLRNAALVIAKDYNRSKVAFNQQEKMLVGIPEEKPETTEMETDKVEGGGHQKRSKVPAFIRRIFRGL